MKKNQKIVDILYGLKDFQDMKLYEEKSNKKICSFIKKTQYFTKYFANCFVNSRPFVTSNIVGATSLEQLKENINSININLTQEMLNDIEDIHLSDPILVFKNN